MYNPLELRDDLKKDEDRDPFGRVPPKPKPEPELTNLGDASKLSRPVGEQGKNDRRDVAKVETMLGRTGALDLKKTDGPTGYWGERTREATRAFQKQNGLKVDGQINPGGETIRALAKVAGGLIKTLAGNTAEKAQPAMQPAPRVTDAPVRHPDISTRHSGAGRDRGRQTAAWPTHPSPSRLQSSPPYALTDDVVSENQRMARALAKRRGIGDFDRFTTDAINTDGAKAVYEIGDLIKQVRVNDPAQADELLEKTRNGIAPANVRLLAQIAAAEGADQVTEPARRDAPVQQTPESQDAQSPSAPKDSQKPSEGPFGISMDEHGQYYDKDGKPISDPDTDPDIKKAQLAPPAPGVAPLPGGAAPASPEDIDKALKNAGGDANRAPLHDEYKERNDGKGAPLRVTIRPSAGKETAFPKKPVNAPHLEDRQDAIRVRLEALGIDKAAAARFSKKISEEQMKDWEARSREMDDKGASLLQVILRSLSGTLWAPSENENILRTPGANPPRG